MAISDTERRMAVAPFHDAAMQADDEYLDAIRAAGCVNRYKITPEIEVDPRVAAAIQRKDRADTAWLAALRLMGF